MAFRVLVCLFALAIGASAYGREWTPSYVYGSFSPYMDLDESEMVSPNAVKRFDVGGPSETEAVEKRAQATRLRGNRINPFFF